MNVFFTKFLTALMSLLCAINIATPIGCKVPKQVQQDVVPYTEVADEDETNYYEDLETPDAPAEDAQNEAIQNDTEVKNEETKDVQNTPAAPVEDANADNGLAGREENVLVVNDNTAAPADEDEEYQEVNVEGLAVLDTVDISKTSQDNVTLTVYGNEAASTMEASKKYAATVGFDGKDNNDGIALMSDGPVTVVISGEGEMEPNVYRHFVDVDKYIDVTMTLIANEYGIAKEDVTYTLPEGVTDFLDVDAQIQYYTARECAAGRAGKPLYINDNIREALNPADLLKFSPEVIGFSGNVTSISEGAFLFCDDLTEIRIPATVKTIGDNAFAYCSNLSKVVISKGVETIGAGAFMHCDKLEAVTIPATVTSVGDDAFVFMKQDSIIVCGSEDVFNLVDIDEVVSKDRTEIFC